MVKIGFCLLGILVVLAFVESKSYGKVLAKMDYEIDQLLPYQPSRRPESIDDDENDKELDEESPINDKESNEDSSIIEVSCCLKCIYIPGYGCLDPSDPSIHPE
ncbi:hypothetical protein ABEB36_014854 [Hypothenemus hampei]|uniref:Uncharacterized protein n=1 Tax=Hypothenemus hampei TaxID=57062 RepID=A0ABD1E220_HYPHA